MGPDSGILLLEFIETVVPLQFSHLKKSTRIEYQAERVPGGPTFKCSVCALY